MPDSQFAPLNCAKLEEVATGANANAPGEGALVDEPQQAHFQCASFPDPYDFNIPIASSPVLKSKFDEFMHPESAVGAINPGEQVHVVAPAIDTSLSKQGTQVVFEVAPDALLAVPAGQGTGLDEDAGQKKPAGHSTAAFVLQL